MDPIKRKKILNSYLKKEYLVFDTPCADEKYRGKFICLYCDSINNNGDNGLTTLVNVCPNCINAIIAFPITKKDLPKISKNLKKYKIGRLVDTPDKIFSAIKKWWERLGLC